MNWIKGLIIFLVIFLTGFIIYTLYHHLGPYKRLSVQNQELREEVASLKKTLEELDVTRSELVQKNKHLEDLQTKLEVLMTTVTEMEVEKQIVVREAERLREELKESEGQIGELLLEFESLRGEYTQKAESLEDQIALRDGQIQDLEIEADQLHQTIATLKGNVKVLGGETRDLKRQLEESRSRIQEMTQEVAAKEEELAGLTRTYQATIEQLQKERQEGTALIGVLQGEIESLRGEYGQKVGSLEEEVKQKDRQIQDLEAQAEQLRHTVTALKENRNTFSKETAELKRQLQQSRSRLEELSQGMTARESKLEEMEKTHQDLVKRLREQVDQQSVQISALEERLNIRFLDKVLFSPGNAVITSRGREILTHVAEELKKLSDTRIHVEGHSDNLPLSNEARAVYIDNLGLSTARASAVARTLRTMGVDAEVLSAAGYSMYRPIASNDTPEGREQNRRVEIILAPLR